MLHVKTDELYGKNPIVNVNDLRTHIINIDSRFRKSQIEPPTDFQYEFAHPYKNVIKARIASVEIPAVFYAFSIHKKNTMFRLDATDYMGQQHYIQINIQEGNYTPQTLITAIQRQLDGVKDMYGIFFRITVDEQTQRTTIQHDGSAPPPCPICPTYSPVAFGLTFGMIGLEDRTYDFGLGYNLGFTKQLYVVGTQSITSESVISTSGDNYLLLAIDDMYTVEHKTHNDYIQCLAKILIKRCHGSQQNVIFDDGYTVLSNEIIFPRPVDLKQVRIRVLDMYGVPIDIHYTNLSISLEVTEVMNVQMYDQFRNYLWERKEPRPHGSGSVVTQAGKGFN
jgi:hypothetical protein